MRASLQEQLAHHLAEDAKEAQDLATIQRFASEHENPFDRRIGWGHLTGSALVVATSGGRVLLLHHRKLDRWLQPGGHASPGESRAEDVALREAREETGLERLRLHPTAPRPLDVDVHDIPARLDEPAHHHLDLRYLVLSADHAPPDRDHAETNDCRWFGWEELGALDLDAGLRRALDKARRLVRGGAPGLP